MHNTPTLRYPAKISKYYLFKLSIPIFFSNLALPLASFVDIGLMGHLSNESFLAATSIATSVITMIFWSFGFLRMGTVGIVSQALGKGDYREIVSTLMRNLIIAIVISLIIIISSNQILRLVTHFFNPSDETNILIGQYISIRVLSAPAELSLYVLVGLYLGLQKTKISSFMITFFCLLNIIISSYFVLYLDLEIFGVALGTLIAAYFTILIFLAFTYFYIKNKFNIIPRVRKVLIAKKIIALLNINFNIFIRTILLTFAFLWVTLQGSKLGEEFLAINSILMQFVILSSFFLDSYAFSTEGVIGYSVGQKNIRSFKRAVASSISLSFYTGLLISIFYIFFFKFIINALTDIDYLRFLSYEFIIWVILMPPIASFCYQYDGIFIGASQTTEIRNAMIVSVALFIMLSLYCVKHFGNHGLWFSLVFFMAIRSITLLISFKNILKKFK